MCNTPGNLIVSFTFIEETFLCMVPFRFAKFTGCRYLTSERESYP